MSGLFFISRRSMRGRGGYLELWRIAYPLVIMSAGNTVMQFVDRKFLSFNSTLDVAAALPAGILYFTMFGFFMVTANFTGSLVAQYWGAGQRRALLGAVWTGFYFATAASLLIVFAMPSLGEYLIRLAGHSEELTVRELEYFSSLIPSGAFACMAAPFFSFFSGRGKTGIVAVVVTIGCVLNVPLDYAFIFGWGPIPVLGILGAGIATSLCAMLTFLIVLVCFLRMNQAEFPTRSVRPARWSDMAKLLKFGSPAGVQTFFDVGAFSLVTFLIGVLGSVPLAAHVIALSINNMFFIPLLGLSDATSILAGQYIGKKKHDISESVVYRAWRMALIYMSCGAVVYWFLPEMLASIFAPDADDGAFAEVVALTRWLLALAAVFNFVDTVKFIFMAALRGAGDTRAVLWISSGCAYLLMVPGVFFLIRYLHAPVTAVWAFMVFTAGTEAFLIWRRFHSGAWRRIRLVETRDVSTL